MNKTKKGIKIAFKVIGDAILALAILLYVSSMISLFTGNTPSLFGNSFYIVQTDSMKGTIEVDELVTSHVEKIENIQIDDIITFECNDQNSVIYGQVITHRVINIEEIDGEIYLTTKGDANPIADTYKVDKTNFKGKVVGHSLFLGKIITFFTKHLLIFVIFGVSFIAFMFMLTQLRKYHLEKENKAIEQEEKERKELLKQELLAEIKKELKNED